MKSPYCFAALLTGLTVWFCPSFARAEPSQGPPRSFSFMPAPAERTRWFLAGHVGASYRLTEKPTPANIFGGGDDEPWLVTGQLGLMRNMGRHYALGMIGHFETSMDLWRLGLSPRFTYWITSSAHVDVEPLLIFHGATDRDATYPALGFHMSLNPRSWLGLDIRAEKFDYVHKTYTWNGEVTSQQEWTNTSWYAGFRLGGYPGLIVAGAGGLVFLFLAAAASSTTVSF